MGSSFATNTSGPPVSFDRNAPGVAGKAGHELSPEMMASPYGSTLIARATSYSSPPRYVAYSRWVPSGLTLATAESQHPPGRWHPRSESSYDVSSAPGVAG